MKLFNLSLLGFIAVSTFFYVPTGKSVNPVDAINWGYTIQELFFRYGVFVLFALSLNLRPLRVIKNPIIGAFLIYLVFISIFKGFGLDTRRTLLNIFTGFLFFKLVYEHFDFSYLKTAGLVFLGVIFLNIFWCVLQFFDVDPLFTDMTEGLTGNWDKLVGMMKIKVHLGVMAVVMFPFLYILNPFLSVFAIPLLIVSKSSTAALAMASSVGLIAFSRLKRRVFILLSVLVVLLSVVYVFKFDMPDGQFFERFKVWYATTSMSLRGDAWFGQGLGSFAGLNMTTEQVTVNIPKVWTWCHNEYLQLMYETGLIGLGFCLVFVSSLFSDFWKNRKDPLTQVLFSGVFSILVSSFIHFPFHLGRFSALCLFTISVFWARINDLKVRIA